MKLSVLNLTATEIGLGSPVGTLRPKESRIFDVSVTDLERLGPDLVRLSGKNSLAFSAYNDPGATTAELDTQFTTTADLPTILDPRIPGALADIATLQNASRIFHEPTISPSRATSSPGGGPQPLANGALMMLTFTVNNTSNRAYRVFKIPTSYLSDASFHAHWTKSSNANDLNNTVRWRIGYNVFNGRTDVANNVETSATLDGTYLSSGTTDRIVYRTADVPAVGFVAGYYVSIYVEAITPTGTPLSADPGLVSLDLMYRATINVGN